MYFVICSLILTETFLIRQVLNEIWSKMYIGLPVKFPLFLSDLNETWFFSTDFQKIVTFQISRNFSPAATNLFFADGPTA
jgi:hypothetical protein